MRSAFTSWVQMRPALAFAGAGAMAPPSLPWFGAGDLLDSFLKIDRPPFIGRHGPDPIRHSLFARTPHETPVVPSRVEENIDTVDVTDVPPPADSGGAGSPATMVSAYDVHMAFLTMRTIHKVILNDADDLVQLIVNRRWIEEVGVMEREKLKELSADLDSQEAELEIVKEALGQKGPLLKRIQALWNTMFSPKQPAGSQPGVLAAASTLGFSLRIRTVWGRKRELDEAVLHGKIASEWLERTAWSCYGYIRLTDAGCEVLDALDRNKGDPRMDYTPVDDYLHLIGIS